MIDQELSDYLAARKAAAVHLSHHAVMKSSRPIFPDDMHRTIAKRTEFNLSCVVLWPSHGMDLPGSFGVILKPLCATVEHVFGVVKRLRGFAEMRYRGLAKNATRALTALALANIYLNRQRLMAQVRP